MGFTTKSKTEYVQSCLWNSLQSTVELLLELVRPSVTSWHTGIFNWVNTGTFKGTVQAENDQALIFFPSNEVSTGSRCCCGILQLCNLCKKGVWGVERHYNPSLFKKYAAEKSLSWKVSNSQLLKNRTLTVFELKDRFWYQKKRYFVSYKVTESFFFQFSYSEKKLRRLIFQLFR